MMKVKSVEVGVLVARSMRDVESGRRFLQLLLKAAPCYAPERYNNFEPITVPFDSEKIDEALQKWGFGFLWRRSKPAILGSAWVGGADGHDKIYLSIPLKGLDVGSVLRLFGALEDQFGVDLAYIHIRTDEDSLNVEHYKQHIMPFSQGLSTRHLREGLPSIAWATVFGSPYVELFGRERLVSTPAARVELIGSGIYVQLTADPSDVSKRRDEYLVAQHAAKEHLDRDAFRGMSKSGKCRVPEFFLVTH